MGMQDDFMMGRLPQLAAGPNNDKPLGGIFAIFAGLVKVNIKSEPKGFSAMHLDKGSTSLRFEGPRETHLFNSSKKVHSFVQAIQGAHNDIAQNAAKVRIEGPQIEGITIGGSDAGGGFVALATPSVAGGGRGGRGDV